MRKVIVGCILAPLAFAPMQAASIAAEYFVPQGHTYSPDSEQMPSLNSRKDRLQARTDEIETKIYHEQLRRRRFIEQMNSFEDHEFGNRARRQNNW